MQEMYIQYRYKYRFCTFYTKKSTFNNTYVREIWEGSNDWNQIIFIPKRFQINRKMFGHHVITLFQVGLTR